VRVAISNSMRTWGGGENWSLTAASGLAARGHEVMLVCQEGGELQKRALGAPARGLSVRAMAIRGDFDPPLVLRAARMLREARVQAVCCNLDREVRTLGVAARLAGRIPFARRRGSDYGFKNSLRYRITYRHLVDRILVNSDSTRRSVLSRNAWLPPEKVVRIYNGIDTDAFFPERSAGQAFRLLHGLGQSDLVVGIVGSLLPRKRHITLFRAAASLAGRFPDLRILVCGPSPKPIHLRSVEQSARDCGIADRVVYTGPVSGMRACYNSLDILAMPSENEGFGYAAAEAMSCGVPVVVSDASSLPEVAGADGAAGLIFPLDDCASLASDLESLLSDPVLRGRMGAAAAERVRRMFGMDAMLDSLEEFLTALAGIR